MRGDDPQPVNFGRQNRRAGGQCATVYGCKRAKLISSKNDHGVSFICFCLPQLGQDVSLLLIRQELFAELSGAPLIVPDPCTKGIRCDIEAGGMLGVGADDQQEPMPTSSMMAVRGCRSVRLSRLALACSS